MKQLRTARSSAASGATGDGDVSREEHNERIEVACGTKCEEECRKRGPGILELREFVDAGASAKRSTGKGAMAR
jgi:hypothetical protein